MVHDVVRLAQIKYYEEEIGRLLAKRQELLAQDEDGSDALAKIVGEKIIELIGKLEESK